MQRSQKELYLAFVQSELFPRIGMLIFLTSRILKISLSDSSKDLEENVLALILSILLFSSMEYIIIHESLKLIIFISCYFITGLYITCSTTWGILHLYIGLKIAYIFRSHLAKNLCLLCDIFTFLGSLWFETNSFVGIIGPYVPSFIFIHLM